LPLIRVAQSKPAFPGDTTSDILAAVIKEEPGLEAIPQHLRPIIAKCLRKDPHTRWRDIGDVRLALEEGPPIAPAPVRRRSLLPWALAGVFAIALSIASMRLWRLTSPIQLPLMRLSLEFEPSIDPNGERVYLFPRMARV